MGQDHLNVVLVNTVDTETSKRDKTEPVISKLPKSSNISQSNSGKELTNLKQIKNRRMSKLFSPSKSPMTSRKGSIDVLKTDSRNLSPIKNSSRSKSKQNALRASYKNNPIQKKFIKTF